ncbi:hypothetical protein [Streptomyces netropsis]|uniref:Uncharacterized protein n=1 Tax=Streptomyces netropsis TaxID=55404 RepID=A0A7W7LBV5_STRNE|nr:hypothetical protein [Streptomyces netropsis]MBB4887364.1 hypothetical protein [Streptomyces netropsis]GGR09769.1 hypothetical protein GCM10010219_12930 [Streptomyces netropsis]
MSSPSPLIVPVQVDALLVNERVRANETWRRWDPDFERLDERQPPEPDPFGSSATGKPGHGIHLQWLVPDALRRGRQDGPAGKVEFPIVPNRWLVVRYSRPTDRPGSTPSAVGWVVDSDFLDDADGTSSFLDPWAEGLKPAWIGRLHDLAEAPWTEPAGRRPFLTAVGPGLPTFATFQPYNKNVFSLHDPLTDLEEPSLLSYLVVGWYSDPAWDILAAPPGGDVRALLESLRWSTTESAFRPARSLYAGSALGLSWKIDGDRPDSDKPDVVTDIDVAVGHVATDAETALHPAALDDPEAARLWEAFCYDLLDVLDEDGDAALDQATRRTWFGNEQGGYTWRIVDRPPADGSPQPRLTPQQSADERQWLAALNATQAEHDAASRELSHFQRRLYGLWWLHGRPTLPGPEWKAACEAQFDPDGEGTVAAQARDKLTALFGENGLRSRIPWGDTAEELADRVHEYATDHCLLPGRELQRCAEPAFHSTPDPSVIIRGAKLDRPLTDEADLACRTSEETVTQVRIRGEMTAPPAAPPAPDLTGLPETTALDALLGEFFLLDLAAVTPGGNPDATALEEALARPGVNVTGTVARWMRQWRQPWSPLHLIWKMNCYPTPYRSDGQDHWTFCGTRYRWQGTGDEGPTVLAGRAMLNPLPGFTTRARLAQHADTHPRGPVEKLRELRARAEDWDLLSQRIDGVNDWLAQHTTSTNLAPVDALADLVDNRTSRVSLSEVPEPGPASGSDRTFQPVRAAQLTFEQLHVIDRFGRSLAVISPDNVASFPILPADSVTPDIPVLPENPYRFIQLPPRLLQPTRLRFDFVSTKDDHHRVDVDAGPGEAAGESPVCGWLVANHLSRSLLVHAPDGAALGEIRAVLDTAHQQLADWDPLPESPYPDLGPDTESGRAFAAELPHLYGFVTKLLEGGADAFAELLTAVDRSMSATTPGEDDTSLAALVGRPMALLRARLKFELNGPPMTSSSWSDVVEQPAPEPEFTSYLWNVRLGAGDILSDGLAGFFLGSDYTRLYTVPEPETRSGGPGYAAPIDGQEIAIPARPVAPPARIADEAAAWVTLLADPWAAVHAVTDLLPVGRLLLPPTWVREPLARMKLSFRMGPLLAGTRMAADEQGGTPTPHLVMPGPSGWRGTWQWAEPAAAGRAEPTGSVNWTTYPLTTPDAVLALTDTGPAARTGFLQLSGALGDADGAERRPPAQGPDRTPGSTS